MYLYSETHSSSTLAKLNFDLDSLPALLKNIILVSGSINIETPIIAVFLQDIELLLQTIC